MPAGEPSALRIRSCTLDDARPWDEFVARQTDATLYHDWRWRGIIEAVSGRACTYLAATDARGTWQGVLPLARLKSFAFGDFLVSLPYVNYAGVLAPDAAISATLANHAADLAQQLGCRHLELRQTAPVLAAWPTRTDKVSMWLPLPGDPDLLFKGFDSKLRAQIRRPTKEGATCTSGGRELLDDFYGVFAANMRDLGTPVYARQLFARILDAFPEQARLFVVRLADKPVAAGLVLGYRNRLEIPWASSLRSVNRIGANMLLYWSVLEFAVREGYGTFDFGRCTRDSGTFRFKRQWGAEPVGLHWHYWVRGNNEMPRLNHSNPKFALATRIWQRLPLPVANLIGPGIVRSLP